MDKPDCQFCNFLDREVVIHEDEIASAVTSRRPINRYHALVIPKRHYGSFIELPGDVAAHLFLLTKRVSAAVRQVCHPETQKGEGRDQMES